MSGRITDKHVSVIVPFQKTAEDVVSLTCMNTIVSQQLRHFASLRFFSTGATGTASFMGDRNSILYFFFTLIQPASKWMHWATLRRHSDLFIAAISASSQVIPIFDKSLLTVLLQLSRRRPEPLLNPRTYQ